MPESSLGLTQAFPCPYLADREAQYLVFDQHTLSYEQADQILALGIRRFGSQFFRPLCQSCQACVPLRVEVKNFALSSSQKRVFKLNQDLQFTLQKESYSPEYFLLYQKHNLRFKQQDTTLHEEDFHRIHFQELTDNSLVSRVTYQGRLIAFGLLEAGHHSLSSQYFVFDPVYGQRSLGTWGAIQEINWARQNQLEWYYLGYWIKENPSMDYKKNFRPHQLYDWSQSRWQFPLP